MQIQSTPKRMNENYNPRRRITLEALHNRIQNLDIFIYIMRTLKVFFFTYGGHFDLTAATLRG